MGYNALGRKRFWTTIAVLAITLINLGLSGRVNSFQDFFYVADQFPFALSIITFVMYSMIFAVDLTGRNAFIVRAPFLIGFELLLCIFWTAGNAFSTSRWRHIPLQCDEIPQEFDEERSWCKDLQALKSFVWIEWVILVLTFIYTLYYIYSQHQNGTSDIWSSSLSRASSGGSGSRHVSEFLQYPTRPQTDGPTPIAEGFTRSMSRGYEDMTQYQTDTFRRSGGSGDFAQAKAGTGYSASYQGQGQGQSPGQTYDSKPYAGAYARSAYPNQATPGPQGGYAYSNQPDMPPQGWVGFTQEEGVRDSVAGGPGLAGVGAGPAPGAYGGFERM